MYKKILILLFAVVSISIQAQDLSIHMMDSVYARTAVNPAYRFNDKVVVNILGLSTGSYTNGISIGDILIKDGGLNQFQLKEGADKINDLNYITGEGNIHLIGLGLTFGKWQFSAGYDWHLAGGTNYTKDLYLLAANGNAPYIGETLDVGPDLLLQGYHDLHIGASYQMSNISVGARIKLLSGINDLSTSNSSVQLTTDEEIYQLTVASDYVMNTTGVVDYDGIDNIDVDGDSFGFSNFLGPNSGIGLDLGIDWKAADKISLSASVLDIGNISWSEDVVNYNSNQTNTFEGVDILDYIDDDNEVVLEDSLYNLLDFEESNNTYSTSLGTKFHLSARYIVSPKVTIGANYYKVNNQINDRYMISANAQYEAFSWLSLGGGLASTSSSSILIPFNVMLDFGPVTTYMSSDNIMSAFSITSSRVSQLRLGFQLGF